ncbi:hypothetical protein [Sphingomonas panaciterrae]|uniref:hypothetical protein n=1 Tax=Sphingomonas panaciterrae TaxID=1462999 RepID=UPI002FF3B8A4
MSDEEAMPDEGNEPSGSIVLFKPIIEKAVVNLLPTVRYRALNSLEGFRRAKRLFDLDREMASFRAITAEEEAVTALFKALQVRGYTGAEKLNSRSHQHKAAAPFFMNAVLHSVAANREVKLTISIAVKPPSVTVALPLNQFDKLRNLPADLHMELVHPLDMVRSRHGVPAGDYFDESVAAAAGDRNVDKLILKAANSRNKILYAHDSGLPASRITISGIEHREASALRFIIYAIAVLQVDGKQALAQQCLDGFLKVLGRQPPERMG